MTDTQLCWAWRASFTALQRSEYADEREALAAARASYLDELEYRDPAGFARWIADGARAASDPGRYLRATTGRSPDPTRAVDHPAPDPEGSEAPKSEAGE